MSLTLPFIYFFYPVIKVDKAAPFWSLHSGGRGNSKGDGRNMDCFQGILRRDILLFPPCILDPSNP